MNWCLICEFKFTCADREGDTPPAFMVNQFGYCENYKKSNISYLDNLNEKCWDALKEKMQKVDDEQKMEYLKSWEYHLNEAFNKWQNEVMGDDDENSVT